MYRGVTSIEAEEAVVSSLFPPWNFKSCISAYKYEHNAAYEIQYMIYFMEHSGPLHSIRILFLCPHVWQRIIIIMAFHE